MTFHARTSWHWTLIALAFLSAPSVAAQPATPPPGTRLTTAPADGPIADASWGTGPVLLALSESAELESDEGIREKLSLLGNRLTLHPERRQFDDLAPAAQAPQMPPEALAQMRTAFDRAIEGIEKELARIPENEVETRRQIAEALQATRRQRAESLGEVPPAAPAVAPVAPAAIKRPPKGDKVISLATAVADLRTMLIDNAPPAALAAFAGSPDYASAPRASKAAAAAMLQKRPMAALAGLLRAHELATAEPEHLSNLGGLANKLGLPRHALALLAAVEKLAKPIPAGAGLDGRAAVLVNRGHALIVLGRYDEAETVLRQAVAIDPTFAEARANLSLALWQQRDEKKKDEAVRFARMSRKRSSVADAEGASAPAPPSREGETPDAGGKLTIEKLRATATRARGGRPVASAVFNLSRGKSGSLPTIKIPQKIIDGKEMDPKVQALHEELTEKSRGLIPKMAAAQDAMRQRERAGGISPISTRRARDVFWYIGNAHYDPSLHALYVDQNNAANDIGVGTFGGQLHNPWASHELEKAQQVIWAAHLGEPDRNKLMHAATEPYHGDWQGPIRNYETAVNQFFRKRYAFQTALAANLSDPLHHRYASLLIEQQAYGLAAEFVHTLGVVTRHDAHFISIFGTDGQTGEAEDAEDGDLPAPDACGPHFSGEYKASVSVGFVEVSGNCEKVGVELSAGEWVKAFGEVEYTFESGEISIFLGGAGEASAPGTGVKAGAKGGCYITLNDKGEFVDAGFKTTRSSGVEIDVVVGSVGYEREIETPYSLVAAFSD